MGLKSNLPLLMFELGHQQRQITFFQKLFFR